MLPRISTLILILAGVLVVTTAPTNPGDSCHPTQDPCKDVPNTECADNGSGNYICKCNAGLITDTTNRRCIAVPRRPGDPCALTGSDGGRCELVSNSQCIRQGAAHTCVCNAGFGQLPEKCLRLPELPADECHPTEANCNNVPDCSCRPAGGRFACLCDDPLVTDEQGKQCLRRPVHPEDECHPSLTRCDDVPNTNCELSSEASGFTCRCTPAFVTAERKCWLKPLKPGEPCHVTYTPCTGVQEFDTDCEPDPATPGERYCACRGDLVTDVNGGRCLTRPVRPGDTCHPTLTPCAFDDNVDCLQLGSDEEPRCHCTGDYVDHPVEHRCVRKPRRPGDECLPATAPCNLVDDTECKGDPMDPSGPTKCMCDAPLLTDIPNARCIPRPVWPGDACAPSVGGCDGIANTTCDADGDDLPYCKCTEEFLTDPVGHRCLLYPTKPGQRCVLQLTGCERVPPTFDPTTCATASEDAPGAPYDFCQCAGDLVTDEVGERCLRIPGRPGDGCHPELTPCIGDGDLGNTTCVEGKCICDEPYLTDPDRGRCLLMPSAPGQLCDPVYADCADVTGTECERPSGHPEYSCRCTDGMATDPDNGLCIEQPTLPGHPCHPDEADCEPHVVNTTCQQIPESGHFRCECLGDMITDPYGFQCLELPTQPGDPCQPIVAPCQGDHPFECAPDPDNGGYFCKCNQGYITLPGKCISLPLVPGDECDVRLAPCNGAPLRNTSCLAVGDDPPRCICNEGLVTDHGICFPPPTRPGDTCSHTLAPCVRTQPPTTCDSNGGGGSRGPFCRCDPEAWFTDFRWRECVPLPQRPADRCDAVHLDTTCVPIPHSTCVPIGGDLYNCRCDPGYFTTPEVCVSLPARPYDRCLNHAHCSTIPHTHCVPGGDYGWTVCACEPGYDLSLDGETCRPRAEFVNDPCQIDSNCAGILNTRCDVDDFGQGYCKCVPDTTISPTRRYCLPIVRQLQLSCVEDVQCAAGIGVESECSDQKCTCRAEFVENSALNLCLPKSGLDGPCREPQQCTAVLGPHSECTPLQACACTPTAGFLNDRCHRRVALGDACGANEECVLGTNAHTVCSLDKCACAPSSIPWQASCFADLSLGDACASDPECSVPIRDGVCDRRDLRCVCPVGMNELTEKICWKSSGASSIHLKLSLAFVSVLFLGYS